MIPCKIDHGCGNTVRNMACFRSLERYSSISDFLFFWLGFYQRGDPNNALSIETSFLSLDLFQEQCNQTFGEGLPASPQVQNVNKYGGWNMNPSNVMFSNGECECTCHTPLITVCPSDMTEISVFCYLRMWNNCFFLFSRPLENNGVGFDRIQFPQKNSIADHPYVSQQKQSLDEIFSLMNLSQM